MNTQIRNIRSIPSNDKNCYPNERQAIIELINQACTDMQDFYSIFRGVRNAQNREVANDLCRVGMRLAGDWSNDLDCVLERFSSRAR